jgi:hypothetical protein
MANPNHDAEQAAARERKRLRRIADQKAKGTYVPTPKEALYEAMIPAFRRGMTKDEVRTLLYKSRCVHSQGTALATSEVEEMLEDLMQQNLFEKDILEVAAIEKHGITTPVIIETGIK